MGEVQNRTRLKMDQHKRLLTPEALDLVWVTTYASALVGSVIKNEEGFRCDPGQATLLADLAVRHAREYHSKESANAA